jgi:hypothetical protein
LLAEAAALVVHSVNLLVHAFDSSSEHVLEQPVCVTTTPPSDPTTKTLTTASDHTFRTMFIEPR